MTPKNKDSQDSLVRLAQDADMQSIRVLQKAGLIVGLVIGIVIIGKPDAIATLSLGLCGIAVFVTLHVLDGLLKMQSDREFENLRNDKLRDKNRQRIPRSESEGPFEERMERYFSNVERGDSSPDGKSRMTLWIAEDGREYERTPPKPIYLIRMLLHRIQRILSGG